LWYNFGWRLFIRFDESCFCSWFDGKSGLCKTWHRNIWLDMEIWSGNRLCLRCKQNSAG
jgi:hypothetical protein